MITNNLKKSYTGQNKTDGDKIPTPLNGDTTSGRETSSSCENTWRYGNAPLIFQCGFLNNAAHQQSSYGYSNHYMWKGGASSGLNNGTGGWFVDVGLGNTAESPTDYKLADGNAHAGGDNNANNYTAGSSYLTHKYGRVLPGSGVTESIMMPENESDTILYVESVYANEQVSGDVVIKEMGLIRCLGNVSSGSISPSNFTKCNYLVARKVLATPVTIHPGETYKFIYRLKA